MKTTAAPRIPPAASHVFLTGATGYIGSAIARELIARKYRVTALVRAASAHRLPSGVMPVIGDLKDPVTYTDAAAACDAVIHAAYEYADGGEVHSADAAAVDTFVRLARAQACHVIYASSAFMIEGDAPEQVALPPLQEQHARLRREARIVQNGGAAIRIGLVYGGRAGTMPLVFSTLASCGEVPPLAALTSRWSMIYRGDLARLFVAVLEAKAADIFNGVDGAPLAVREVVQIAQHELARRGYALKAAGKIDCDDAVAWAKRPTLARDIALVPERATRMGWTPLIASFAEGVVSAIGEWEPDAQDGGAA